MHTLTRQLLTVIFALVTISAVQAQSPLNGTTYYNSVGTPYSYGADNTWTTDSDGDGKPDMKATYVVEGAVLHYTYQQLPTGDPCPLSAKRTFRFAMTETSLTLTPESDDCPARAQQWQPAGSSRTYYNQAFYEKKLVGSHGVMANNSPSTTIDFRADGTCVLLRDGKTTDLGKWQLKGPMLTLQSPSVGPCKQDATYLVATETTPDAPLLNVVCDYCYGRRNVVQKVGTR